ncbi:MAG: hypothetical protein QME81_05575, partial [bacterium]|nr:hypothetical protein [bacterium]
MKRANERIRVLIAELNDDLGAMEGIESRIDELYQSLEGDNIADKDKAALGYYLHNLYNAAESILKRLAGFFENSIGGGQWHADLLKRMRLEIEEIRPAVISKDSYSLLNELRKFRHLFRRAYDYTITPQHLRCPRECYDCG